MFAEFMRAAPKQAGTEKFIRLFHRWVSVLFVLAVVGVTIALAQPKPIMWVSYVPLLPLALLALSGIYLFVRPYFP